ncbi:MAG: hypothetical protein NTZ90_09390 [Proteobacteria bacterium]|nr:hypothetical protein [Pseudomonadota bacterium]
MFSSFRAASLGAALALLPVMTSSARAVSVDEPYVYLLCNATSFNQDSRSQLHAFGNDPDTLSLLITVTEPWMTSAGDDCLLLGTSAQNQWDYIVHYGLRDARVAQPDAMRYLYQSAGPVRVILKYPQRGIYRFTLHREQGAFSITGVSAEAKWRPLVDSNH